MHGRRWRRGHHEPEADDRNARRGFGLGRRKRGKDALHFAWPIFSARSSSAGVRVAMQGIDFCCVDFASGVFRVIGLPFELDGDGEPGQRHGASFRPSRHARRCRRARTSTPPYPAWRPAEQLDGLLAIPLRAPAIAQEQGEIVLRHRDVAVGSLLVPFCGLGRIAPTTKPRSCNTPTLNAAAGDPASAARSSQPAPDQSPAAPRCPRSAGAPAPPSRAGHRHVRTHACRRSARPSIRLYLSAWRTLGAGVASARAPGRGRSSGGRGGVGGAGGGASLIVVSEGAGGGAGGDGAVWFGAGGDCGCESLGRIAVAVPATAASGSPTSRAVRRKRHSGLPVILHTSREWARRRSGRSMPDDEKRRQQQDRAGLMRRRERRC